MTFVYAEPENQLGPDLWERYPGEPKNAFGYFEEFCALGRGRKVRDLAEKVRKTPEYLYKLSSRWNWSVRANAKDLDRMRQREIELHDQWMAVEAAKLLCSRGLLHWAAKGLGRMNDEKVAELTPTELARWAATGAQLGRTPFGEPDQRIHLTGDFGATPMRPISGMTDTERRAELAQMLARVSSGLQAGEIDPEQEQLYRMLALPEQQSP